MTDHALLPEHDADVPAFWQSLDLPGLLDVHVHFLPKPIMDRRGHRQRDQHVGPALW